MIKVLLLCVPKETWECRAGVQSPLIILASCQKAWERINAEIHFAYYYNSIDRRTKANCTLFYDRHDKDASIDDHFFATAVNENDLSNKKRLHHLSRILIPVD